jgi:hypothetical protein
MPSFFYSFAEGIEDYDKTLAAGLGRSRNSSLRICSFVGNQNGAIGEFGQSNLSATRLSSDKLDS